MNVIPSNTIPRKNSAGGQAHVSGYLAGVIKEKDQKEKLLGENHLDAERASSLLSREDVTPSRDAERLACIDTAALGPGKVGRPCSVLLKGIAET